MTGFKKKNSDRSLRYLLFFKKGSVTLSKKFIRFDSLLKDFNFYLGGPKALLCFKKPTDTDRYILILDSWVGNSCLWGSI